MSHPDPPYDREASKLLPALSREEREQLEANIVADGCRDPLVEMFERDLGGEA